MYLYNLLHPNLRHIVFILIHYTNEKEENKHQLFYPYQ